ncbi:MAG: biliverdin-producing heme oxygenase [Pseudorhodoplanes sp.]|nr:biliverdin-producing heme oxygenase [Pseudorhodoplanes sp.]
MGSVAFDTAGLTFSESLREGTRAHHLEAERSGIVFDILRKRASRNGHMLLLRNLLPAYREMEAGLEQHRDRSPAGLFAVPALYRTHALARDLANLAGDAWIDALPLLPAAEAYASRVSAAAKGDGGRLLAHAYVRYFGDLSGGQALKGLLGRTLSLSAEQMSFYEFPAISDPLAFKNELRAKLDRAVSELADPGDVIEEACAAFQLNIELSNAVAAAARES